MRTCSSERTRTTRATEMPRTDAIPVSTCHLGATAPLGTPITKLIHVYDSVVVVRVELAMRRGHSRIRRIARMATRSRQRTRSIVAIGDDAESVPRRETMRDLQKPVGRHARHPLRRALRRVAEVSGGNSRDGVVLARPLDADRGDDVRTSPRRLQSNRSRRRCSSGAEPSGIEHCSDGTCAS